METITVKAEEARTNFRTILDKAMLGNEVQITRYNEPVATVVKTGYLQQLRAMLLNMQEQLAAKNREERIAKGDQIEGEMKSGQFEDITHARPYQS